MLMKKRHEYKTTEMAVYNHMVILTIKLSIMIEICLKSFYYCKETP